MRGVLTFLLFILLCMNVFAKDCKITDIKKDFKKRMAFKNMSNEVIKIEKVKSKEPYSFRLVQIKDSCGIKHCEQSLYGKIDKCVEYLGTFDGRLEFLDNKKDLPLIEEYRVNSKKKIYRFDKKIKRYRAK